jgi:putative flippase GtrA
MSLSRRELVFRYVAFAAASMAVNLGVQYVSLLVYRGPMALIGSIVAGTGAGFVCKYLLDKRFIFFDPAGDASREAGQVLLYGMTGVLTTLLYLGCELGFWRAFGADWAKYAGGAIGLAVGYWLKYQLDRRFVFTPLADVAGAVAPVSAEVRS